MRGLATLKVHLGAIIAQRQGWKRLRGPPGGALLNYISNTGQIVSGVAA